MSSELEYRLGDIVSVLKGRGLSKAVLDDNGQEECILYGELYTTYGDIIDEVSSRTNISEGVRSVKGDVLVPASTTTNALDVATASCLMRDDVLLGGDINIFRPKKDIDGEFLAYYLSYAKKLDMARLAQGITIVHLYGSDLRKMSVTIPPLQEQKEIITTIEKWDKYIELLDKKIEVKKNVEKYLIQNLLSYKTAKKDCLKEYRLGDIVSVLKGRGLSKAVLDDNGQEECILYGELYTTYGDIIDEVSSRTNISEGVRSVKGDVLVPASTTTNALDVATASCLMRDDVLLGGDINIFRPKKDIDGEFLAYYLSYAKKLDMARLAQGITIVHLYGSDLKKMSVTIPSLEEQKAISSILTQSNKEIDLLENKKSLIEQQRKYLINNLVTGNIRLPKFKNNK